MQLEISREALLRPLQLVSGALGGRPTLPILGNVLLDVSNGLLSLTGTDLEVEMIGQVYLNSDSQDGRTTVPARKLLDICRGLPEGRRSASAPRESASSSVPVAPASTCRPCRRPNTRTSRIGNPCSSSTSASWS